MNPKCSLLLTRFMHRCQWVCHEHAVCHWGGPPTPSPGPWQTENVIVHRRHWRLSYLFLGFLNVSVSVAYYFLFKLDYLVDFRFMNMDVFWEFYCMWLIIWASTVARKRALLPASHCGLFSSHLCGCCLTAPLTTAAAVVVNLILLNRIETVCESARLAPSPCWTAFCFLWST